MPSSNKIVAVLDGKNVFAQANGFKVSRGKIIPAGQFYASLSKSAARGVRKAARKAGYTAHASAKTGDRKNLSESGLTPATKSR